MIRRYIPVDQKNKKRVWPCRAESGVVVSVPTDRVTFTHEDLSGWVKSGVLRELEPVPPPADVIAHHEGATPAIESPAEPEVEAEAEPESPSDPVDEPSGPSREDLDTLTKSDLWSILQERGYSGRLSYRKSSKSDLIDAIVGGEGK